MDSDTSEPAVDTADSDTDGGTETAGTETDTDTGPVEFWALEDGFEGDVTEWSIAFDIEWGQSWKMTGWNVSGDVGLNLLTPHGDLRVDETISLTVGTEIDSLYILLGHWSGADCLRSCNDCDVYGPTFYRATQGELTLSAWEDHAEFELTNLVFEPEFEGEVVEVPRMAGSSVSYVVCEWDYTP